jgi:hypothetical protein
MSQSSHLSVSQKFRQASYTECVLTHVLAGVDTESTFQRLELFKILSTIILAFFTVTH